MINQANNQVNFSEQQFVHHKRFSVIRLTFSVAAIGILFIFLIGFGVQQLLTNTTSLGTLASDIRTLGTIAFVASLVSLILYFVTAFKLRNRNTTLAWFWGLIIADVISYGITLGVLLTLATTQLRELIDFKFSDIVFAFLGAALVYGTVWGLSALPSQQRRYQQTQTLFRIFIWAFFISIIASLLTFVLNFTVFRGGRTNILDLLFPGLSLIVGGIFSLLSVYFVCLQIRNEQDLVKLYESQDPALAKAQMWRSALFFGAWLVSSFMLGLLYPAHYFVNA